MEDNDVPDWLAGVATATNATIDRESQQVTIDARAVTGRLDFGSIPEGWTITLARCGENHAQEVACRHHGKNVEWVFTDVGSHPVTLAANIPGAKIGVQQYVTAHIVLRRKSSRLHLGRGSYRIDSTDFGTEAARYRVLARAELAGALALNGSASPTAIVGKVAGDLTIDAEIDELIVEDVQGGASFNSKLNALVAQVGETLQLRQSFTGRLDVTAKRFTSRSIEASGSIRAEQIAVNGNLASDAGDLTLEASTSIWVLGTLRDVAVAGSAGGSAAHCLFGTQHEAHVLRADPNADQVKQLTHAVEVRNSGSSSGAKVTNCAFSGALDIHFAVDCEEVHLDISGDVIAAGHLLLSGDVPSNTVRSCIVAETLNVGHSVLTSSTIVSADLIENGTVASIGDTLRVISNRLSDARILAADIGVTAYNAPESTIVRSEVRSARLMRLQGRCDEDSLLEATGDVRCVATVPGTLAWADLMHSPMSAAPTGSPLRSVEISENVARLSVTRRSKPTPDSLLISSTGRLGLLALSGDVRLESDADGTRLARISLEQGSHLFTSPQITHMPRVECAGWTSLTTEAPASRKTVEVAAVAASRDARLELRTEGARISIRPVGSDEPGGLPEEMPAVRQDDGELEVHGELPLLVSDPPSSAPGVLLTVPEDGHIRRAQGVISIRSLYGRIEAISRDSSNAGHDMRTTCQVRRWIPIDDTPVELSSARTGQLIGVDVSEMHFADVRHLRRLHVLNPPGEPLMVYARNLDRASGRLKLRRLWRDVVFRESPRATGYVPDLEAETQKLREIADVLRTRANSGATYSAAEWAAAHSHALNVRRPIAERVMRFLHRAVGYGVRPGPALLTFAVWQLLVAMILMIGDGSGSRLDHASGFRPGPYGFWDSLSRAVLLPAGFLRSDIGGALPYRPAFDHPVAHFGLVLGSGIIIGFVAIALKNFLLRPKSDV